MARTIAIGEQDFGKMIENNYFYVDKTEFIKKWWENGDTNTLITRPGRFGKTLIMNMLYYFFSIDHAGRSGLFQNLDVWKEEKYQKLQGTYPVIFLSFANIKADTLAEYGLQDQAQEVKRWYDGFRFGSCDNIYNPWSITQFLDEQIFASYWANTSSNRLVGKLIQKGSCEIKIAVEDLLQGKTIHTVLDEQIVFDQLDEDDASIWSFLLASGYLKIEGSRIIDPDFGEDGLEYVLGLTNLEIVSAFRKMVHGWFSNKRYGYNDFLKALLTNDLVSMNAYMNKIALSTISFFDSGNRASQTEPERFYHGFVLGLVVDLGKQYRITSNRESGPGRYDVLFEPYNSMDDGMIFEFKVLQPEKEDSLQAAANSAIRQILNKKYGTVLASKCSRDKIRIYGFAFKGKEVLIEGGCLNDYEEA